MTMLRVMHAVLLIPVIAVPACRAGGQEPPRHGHPAVVASRVPMGTERLAVMLQSDTITRRLGEYAITVGPAERDGRSLLLVTQVMTLPNAAVVDSMWLSPTTLFPLEATASSPSGRTVLHYSSTAIRGERVAPDGTRSPIEITTNSPVFAASVLGVLVQALPLTRGLHFTVPVHSDPEGVVDASVYVTGEEQLPGSHQPAWRIELQVGEHRAIKWVDTVTRREVRTEADLPGGRRLIQMSLGTAG